MAKFATAAEAQKVGADLFAAGKIQGFDLKPCFGKFAVRILLNGRWFDLKTSEI